MRAVVALVFWTWLAAPGGLHHMAYPRSGAWHAEFTDDFTGYANNAAFLAAYPDVFSFDTNDGVFFAEWGAANGPDGQPGVKAKMTSNFHLAPGGSDKAYGFVQRVVSPQRAGEFRFKVRDLNKGYFVIGLGQYFPESSPGAEDDETDIVLNIQTGLLPGGYGYGDIRIIVSVDSAHILTFTLPGALPDGTAHDIEVMGYPSTDPATGYARLLIDGVEAWLYAGALSNDGSTGPVTTVNYFQVFPSGRSLSDAGGSITNLELDDVLSVDPPQIDNSTPCCHDSVSSATGTGGGAAGSILGPDTSKPLPAWLPRSAGGGVMPAGVAVTHDEDWRTLRGVAPDASLEVTVTPYPTGAASTSRVAMRPMVTPTRVEGRVTSAGWGALEHALSDWRGSPEAATLSVTVNDRDGRFRGIAEAMGRTTSALAKTVFKLISEAGRLAGLRPRILQRGVLATAPTPQPGRMARLDTVDLVGSSWFHLDPAAPLQSRLITREFLTAAGLTNTPADVLGKPYPIVIGEHSDHGVTDVNGNSAEKGLLPVLDLGDVHLTGGGVVAAWAGVQAYAFFAVTANVSNGDTVTVGSVTYTFETVFSNTANHVLIGADAAASKANLVAAINGDAGSGVVYGAATVANPTVEAEIPANLGGGPNTAGTIVARYRTVGVVGNGTPVSTTAGVGSWFHEGGIATTDLHDGADPSVLGVIPPPVLTAVVVGTPGTRSGSYGVCLATAAGQTTLSNVVALTTVPDVFDAANYVKVTWAPPAGWEAIYTALAIGFRVCGRTTATPTKTLAIVDGAAREYHDGELGGVAHVDVEIDPGPPATNTATVVTTSDGDPAAVIDGSTTWGLLCVNLGYQPIDDVFASNLAVGATPARTRLDPTTSPYLLTPASPGWPHPHPWVELIGPTGDAVRLSVVYAGGPILAQHRAKTVTIAVSGRGVTDDGTDAGAPISEASVGFAWLMNQFALQQNWDGRTPWPFVTFEDGTQVLDVAALHTFQAFTARRIGGRGAQMHLYLGDIVTNDQVLQWVNTTFAAYSGQNDDGQYGLWAIDETADPSAAPLFRVVRELAATLPAPTLARDEVENRLRSQFDFDPDAQAYRGDVQTIEDAVSQDIYGLRDATTGDSVIELRATRDAATAADAMARRLFHNKVEPVYQPIPLSLVGLEQPIGSLLRLTHPDGLGVNGYVNRPFFVVRKRLELTPPNPQVTLLARDVYRVYNPDAGTMLDGSSADVLDFVLP